MTKSPTTKRKRETVNFSLDSEIYQRLKAACGLVPMSRQVEELIKNWLQEKETKK